MPVSRTMTDLSQKAPYVAELREEMRRSGS